MKALDGRNDVKVYNLSAGKALPDWLTDRKRRQLAKRDVDFRRRIELIQDFTMPDVAGCVKVSPDGQYVLATGTYKPRVKCYEVAALSLKYERCFDSEVVAFDILSEDYSKLVFLQEERYVELHSQSGRWFRIRIPKFGRDLAYHYPTCDLYIAASGRDVYRLNLNQGRFLNSLQTESTGINACVFNPVHYLFTCGTEDGRVEAWDPRSRHRVGVLDCALHMESENIPISSFTSAKQLGVTAVAYNDALTLGVGTQTGQVLVYDIRGSKPLLVKDHMDGFPIKDVEFHKASGMVLSMSAKCIKIWDGSNGKPHTSIESNFDYNDMCVVPDSGMVFAATEDTKMQTYFLPSLGPAPRWVAHLDALIEELEEEEAPSQFDDYKFVTKEELAQLGLEDLIGTNVLRAVMHGYYMNTQLYTRAKLIANPFDMDDFRKRKLKEKIKEQNQRGIETKKLPKVNREMFERLKETETEGRKNEVAAAQKILKDDRFSSLFASHDFEIDKDSETYQLVNPVMSRMDKKKQRQKRDEEQEEKEFLAAQGRLQEDPSSDDDDDLDSILSLEEDKEEKEEPKPQKEKVKRKFQEERPQKDNVDQKDSGSKKPDRDLTFTAADSLTELKAKNKKMTKLSLADRLNSESHDSESVKHNSFGSREMNYVVKKYTPKFERMRQQQQEHHQERRKVRRSAHKLKGKFKSKDEL